MNDHYPFMLRRLVLFYRTGLVICRSPVQLRVAIARLDTGTQESRREEATSWMCCLVTDGVL